MNKTQRRHGIEFVPIGRFRNPVQIVAQKIIASRTGMHQTIGNNSSVVSGSSTDGILNLLQNQHVRVIVLDQKLHVMLDGFLATKDSTQMLRSLFNL